MLKMGRKSVNGETFASSHVSSVPDPHKSIKKFHLKASNTAGTYQLDLGWARVALLGAAPYSVNESSEQAVWGLALSRQRGVHSVGASNSRQDFDAWPGELAITAPHVPIFSESDHGGESLTIHLNDQPHDKTAAASLWGMPRHVYAGDSQALRLGWQLRKLLLDPQRNVAMIDNQAALLVAHGQARLHHLASGPRNTPPGRYTADRQAHAKVLQLIHDALDTPLPLAQLAHTANMEPLRFLRSFAKALGCTPHAYILEARLQKARKLLLTTRDSLATIAMDCGFAHHSHLGAALKQRLGFTPSAYRHVLRHPTTGH